MRPDTKTSKNGSDSVGTSQRFPGRSSSDAPPWMDDNQGVKERLALHELLRIGVARQEDLRLLRAVRVAVCFQLRR